MRIGVKFNRLVYVLLGAALAAGLLVSVFARPEPRLTASEDCYGLCPSVTALSLSSSTVIYGKEQVEKFSVKVSAVAPGIGVPTGYVVVESGTKILCVIHLHRGKGSCSPAAWALTRGSYKLVAHYSGDTNFKPSTSNTETLTVLRHAPVRHPWVTALWLSGSTVIYGNEQVEKFRVTVTGAPGTGGPTGYVGVKSGTRLLCVIHLHRGKGSCSPAAQALAPGSYNLVAHYSGDTNFKPSTSNTKTLFVLTH
jgi:hypothetical protein